MKSRLRALSFVLTSGIALIFAASIAYADSLEELTVAHRGTSSSKLGEGTLPAYEHAVKTARTCWMGTCAGRKTVPTVTASAQS
jgi:hypothetical protein